LKKKYEEGKEIFQEKVDQGKELIGEKTDQAKDKVLETAEQAKDTSLSANETLEKKYQEGKEYLQEKVDEGKEVAAETTEQAKKKVVEGAQYVGEKVEQAKETLMDKTAQAKEYIAEKAEEAKDFTKEKIQEGKEFLGEMINEGKETTKDFEAPKLLSLQDLKESWNSYMNVIPQATQKAKEKLIEEKDHIIETLGKKWTGTKEKLGAEVSSLERSYGQKLSSLQQMFASLKPFEGEDVLEYRGVLHCGRCGREYSLTDFLDTFLGLGIQVEMPNRISSFQKDSVASFYQAWASWATEAKIWDQCGTADWSYDVIFLDNKGKVQS